MNYKLASFVSLSLFALSACSSAPTNTAPPAKPTLSAAAQQALSQAQTDVQAAKDKFALWTTAASAYKAAQDAAKEGDSDAVIKQATFASSQAALGIAQLSYPTTEPK